MKTFSVKRSIGCKEFLLDEDRILAEDLADAEVKLKQGVENGRFDSSCEINGKLIEEIPVSDDELLDIMIYKNNQQKQLMGNKNYQPPYHEYLVSLGFIETNDGKIHPYDSEYSLDLGEDTFLQCDAFWGFNIEIEGNWNIGITFSDNEDLELFIKRFKKIKEI